MFQACVYSKKQASLEFLVYRGVEQSSKLIEIYEEKEHMKKKIFVVGIITCILYFVYGVGIMIVCIQMLKFNNIK